VEGDVVLIPRVETEKVENMDIVVLMVEYPRVDTATLGHSMVEFLMEQIVALIDDTLAVDKDENTIEEAPRIVESVSEERPMELTRAEEATNEHTKSRLVDIVERIVETKAIELPIIVEKVNEDTLILLTRMVESIKLETRTVFEITLNPEVTEDNVNVLPVIVETVRVDVPNDEVSIVHAVIDEIRLSFVIVLVVDSEEMTNELTIMVDVIVPIVLVDPEKVERD
jgi:hypothetical protein